MENHDWTNCCRYNWRKTFYLARLLMLLTTLRLLSLQVVCTMRERIWYNRPAWTYKVIFENKFTLVLNALIGLKMTHQSDCLKSAYHKVTHKIFHLNLMPGVAQNLVSLFAIPRVSYETWLKPYTGLSQTGITWVRLAVILDKKSTYIIQCFRFKGKMNQHLQKLKLRSVNFTL